MKKETYSFVHVYLWRRIVLGVMVLCCISRLSGQTQDLLYDQGYHDGGFAAASIYDSGYPYDVEVADNFFQLTPDVHEIHEFIFYGLTLKFVPGLNWQEQTPWSSEPFFIRFYDYQITFTPDLPAPVTGIYSIALLDAFGDGWAGDWPISGDHFHTVTVFVNGVMVLDNITLPSGFGPVVHTFFANAGDIISTVFTIDGNYADECYYAIFSPESDVIPIAEDGGTWNDPGESVPTGIPVPVVQEPDWANPFSSQYIWANVTHVGQVWGGQYQLYKFSAVLNTPVNNAHAWVSAQIDATSGSGTGFIWLNSLHGDGQAWQRTTPAKRVSGQSVPAFTNISYSGEKGLNRAQLSYDMAFELWAQEEIPEWMPVTFLVHNEAGVPLPDVMVLIEGLDEMMTGNDGIVVVDLPIGPHTALFQKPGYVDYVLEFYVSGTDEMFFEVMLTATEGEHPIIICPENMTVDNDPGFCHATEIELELPYTEDPYGIVAIFNDAPDIFPVGNTQVTWTAVNAHQQTNSCYVIITVIDAEPPVIESMEDICAPAEPDMEGAHVEWEPPNVSDNCDLESVTSSHQSGDFFPFGTTEVTYDATDINNNTTSGGFTVTVISIECPDDFSMCVTDAPIDMMTMVSPQGGTFGGGSTFNPAAQGVGVWKIVYTYTDPDTGCSASCSFYITVHPSPQVECPADFSMCVTDTPIDMMALVSPQGGTFGGGSNFNPASQGVGVWKIVYTYT
ncbi:MAG: HYR domain-containing protein, partial [Bacteroidia bacterium]